MAHIKTISAQNLQSTVKKGAALFGSSTTATSTGAVCANLLIPSLFSAIIAAACCTCQ